MPNIPLPRKSEPFSSSGFERLYERVCREDKRIRDELSKAISEDPIAVLEHAFQLSEAQRMAIHRAGEKELRDKARLLVHELRTDHPEPFRILPESEKEAEAVPGPQQQKICSCSCIHLP